MLLFEIEMCLLVVWRRKPLTLGRWEWEEDVEMLEFSCSCSGIGSHHISISWKSLYACGLAGEGGRLEGGRWSYRKRESKNPFLAAQTTSWLFLATDRLGRVFTNTGWIRDTVNCIFLISLPEEYATLKEQQSSRAAEQQRGKKRRREEEISITQTGTWFP